MAKTAGAIPLIGFAHSMLRGGADFRRDGCRSSGVTGVFFRLARLVSCFTTWIDSVQETANALSASLCGGMLVRLQGG